MAPPTHLISQVSDVDEIGLRPGSGVRRTLRRALFVQVERGASILHNRLAVVQLTVRVPADVHCRRVDIGCSLLQRLFRVGRDLTGDMRSAKGIVEQYRRLCSSVHLVSEQGPGAIPEQGPSLHIVAAQLA